jgi:spermidine/putrescine transport system ATP-binding protein
VVNEPKVLLLDEPLGALDLKLRKQLQLELHQLQRRIGITFVYVTHDQEEALVMSDRIAVMNAGRIEQIDSAAELYERPRTRFVAQFLGSCNLLPGRVAAVSAATLRVDTPVGQLVAVITNSDRALLPGDLINLALRPEKICLSTTEPAGLNRLPAVIEEVTYCGSETRYRMRSCETTLNVVALNTRPGHQGLHPRTQVWCSFPPEALVPLAD